MPAMLPSEPGMSIRPLTFLQILQAAQHIVEDRLAYETVVRHGPNAPVPAHSLAHILGLPLLYHWTTSGYGAFYGEQPVGWMFLRGWYQVLYIEALIVLPEWRDRGIEETLLACAECHARQLQRQWLGLTITADNNKNLEFYKARGYLRGHWRVLHHESLPPASLGAKEAVRLVPVVGLAARRAFRHYASLDLGAVDAPNEITLARFLARDPYCCPRRGYLVVYQSQPIGYVNINPHRLPLTVYLASGREWWGSQPMVDAVRIALRTSGRAPTSLDLRLGSNAHHDAARTRFEEMGFAEQPAVSTLMFKRISASPVQYGLSHDPKRVGKAETP